MIFVWHIVLSLFTIFLILIFSNIFHFFPIFSIILLPFFSLLPDIDTKNRLTNKFFIFNLFNKIFTKNEHRWITHSIFFSIVFPIVFYLILFFLLYMLWFLINIGIVQKMFFYETFFSMIIIFSHFLWDIITTSWLKNLFYPIKIRIKIPLFYTNSNKEYIYTLFLNIINIILLYLITKSWLIWQSIKMLFNNIKFIPTTILILFFMYIWIKIVFISFNSTKYFLKRMFMLFAIYIMPLILIKSWNLLLIIKQNLWISINFNNFFFIYIIFWIIVIFAIFKNYSIKYINNIIVFFIILILYIIILYNFWIVL